MARTARQDWGFEEITTKFAREPRRRKSAADKPPKAARRPRSIMRISIWLVAIALFLVGLVALHVSILEKNLEYNSLINEKNSLAADNARLSTEVASLSSPARIEEIATGQLGMVVPDKIEYVYIGPDGAKRDYAQVDSREGGDGYQPRTP
jgi:cell division protein FtsL